MPPRTPSPTSRRKTRSTAAAPAAPAKADIRPSLHSIAIVTTPEAEDAVAELLLRTTGESAIVTHDRVTGHSTAAVFSENGGKWSVPGTGTTPLPRIRTLLRAGLDAIAACGLETGLGRIACHRVPATDWRESWKKHFKPLAIGRHLLIRASWHKRRATPGQAEIILDPGLSFGTGQHPTTEFCLREIVRLRPRPGGPAASLLDVGTGSGILAIAASLLGYTPVTGFDFDPEAVTVALENAAANHPPASLTLKRGDVTRLPRNPRTRHAVVCANLTADLLLRHADLLAAHVAPGGHLVLAGILATEFDAVRRAFQRLGLTPARDVHRREWHSGSFHKTA